VPESLSFFYCSGSNVFHRRAHDAARYRVHWVTAQAVRELGLHPCGVCKPELPATGAMTTPDLGNAIKR
jgi:hypothetical protein